VQDGDYWWNDGRTKAPKDALFTSEGVACENGDYSPTGTSWRAASVAAGHDWRARTARSQLVFPVPNAGMREAQVRAYPGKILAVVWVADNGDYVVGVPG
jgi:hypothetical protein